MKEDAERHYEILYSEIKDLKSRIKKLEVEKAQLQGLTSAMMEGLNSLSSRVESLDETCWKWRGESFKGVPNCS